MKGRIEGFLEYEERRAKKTAALVDLLRDPDLSDVVARLVAENPQAPAPSVSGGNGRVARKPGPNPTGVTAKLRSVAPRLPKPFLVDDAVALLTQDGFNFPRDAKSAVRDALYFMVRDKDTFRIARKGRGGKLQQYQYVESPPTQTELTM